MKFKLDRIISIATLAASLVAIILVLKRPAPVAQPQAPAAVVHAQPSDQKQAQPEQATQPAQYSTAQTSVPPPAASAASPAAPSSKADGHTSNSDEIGAAVAQLMGSATGSSGLSPNSNVGSGTPNIKDQQVTYDGDMVHGRFLTEIAGKDVWVTISGRMGQKDGYATFDPTEFKVGDMNVPVSLVNPALQRKLSEERDRLKVTDGGDQQK
jgi:hypothetical protein